LILNTNHQVFCLINRYFFIENLSHNKPIESIKPCVSWSFSFLSSIPLHSIFHSLLFRSFHYPTKTHKNPHITLIQIILQNLHTLIEWTTALDPHDHRPSYFPSFISDDDTSENRKNVTKCIISRTKKILPSHMDHCGSSNFEIEIYY